MCYTAHVRDIDGEVERSKGCANSRTNVAMICSTAKYDGRHTHAVHGVSAQYAIDCCQGAMCNNATDWPELPAVPTHVEKEAVSGVEEGWAAGSLECHPDLRRPESWSQQCR